MGIYVYTLNFKTGEIKERFGWYGGALSGNRHRFYETTPEGIPTGKYLTGLGGVEGIVRKCNIWFREKQSLEDVSEAFRRAGKKVASDYGRKREHTERRTELIGFKEA